MAEFRRPSLIGYFSKHVECVGKVTHFAYIVIIVLGIVTGMELSLHLVREVWN